MNQDMNQVVNMMTAMMMLSMTMGMATPVVVPQRDAVEAHPIATMELTRRLRGQLRDETEASGIYEKLAEDARMIGRPGMARRLEHIAEEERDHYRALSNMLKELER